MEGVGLAASFITIAHLLWITLRYANRILRSLLFETREELTKLQVSICLKFGKSHGLTAITERCQGFWTLFRRD
jgi:hypothetical protein